MSMTDHDRQVIRDSLQFLAAVCDHAIARDDVGFSGATASIGHELANLPDQYWTDGLYALGAQVALVHRKQILRGAVSEHDLPNVEAIGAYRPTKRSDVPSTWAIYDIFNDAITLSIPSSNAVMLAAVAQIPGAFRPAGRGRVWTIPGAFSFALLDELETFDCEPGVADRVSASDAAATYDQRVQTSSRVVDLKDARFTFKFPFSVSINDVIRAAPGAYYNKAWSAPTYSASVMMIEDLKDDHGFLLTADAAAELDRARDRMPPAPSPKPECLPPEMSFSSGPSGELGLHFPYVQCWVDIIRSLPRDSRRWSSDEQCWYLKLSVSSGDDLIGQLEKAAVKVPSENIETLRQALTERDADIARWQGP